MASNIEEIKKTMNEARATPVWPTKANANRYDSSTAAQPAVSPVPAPPVRSSGSGGSTAMTVKAYTRILKLGISATILFVGCYFTIKTAYPFLMELIRPSVPGGVIDKNASTTVKILQQTRGVVAKNDANVDRLNALINDPHGIGESNTAQLASQVSIAPLPPQPEPPAPKPKPQPVFEVRLEPLSGIVLDELHVSGVIGGRSPRITINGMTVGVGTMVDNKRSLRFIALNESQRMIVFGNGVETIEKAY